MSQHRAHEMHPNSLDGFAREKGKLGQRALAVLAAVKQLGSTTDRQVMTTLGFTDPNAVRPRITELIDSGLVEETGRTEDTKTGRRVRVVRAVDRPNHDQMELFDA